ncbi:BON domain-containing protein [bacterium]|nr:BON domain-containing protein [bacterium]MCI0603156.1 BON domain-containing protein [bacterium]
MSKKFGFLILVLSLASLIAIGCNKSTDQAYNEKEAEQPATTEDTIDMADAEITASVKAKLMMDENVAARHVEVETENGIVTLRGTVVTQSEADRAMELAKSAEGVRLVHSYLKTDTAHSDLEDTKSDLKEKTAELGDKAEDAIEDAEDAIETGVKEAGDVGSDAAITAQIKWKLAKDKLVQAADIDVDTKDRRVTLTGTVSSNAEAQRAVKIAKSVEDVAAVDSNLKIHN